MVRGVDKFREYFGDYTGQYTLIGGAACDIILGNLGEDFRATKDLDMVLILEELSDDAISLSAILLDDDYYEILKKGVTVIDDVSVLDLEHIILFKIKAWLDLSVRKERGEAIDSKNIRKHKNDIFHLCANIERESHIQVTGNIRRDVDLFIARCKQEPINLGDLGIKNTTVDELLYVMETCYLVK